MLQVVRLRGREAELLKCLEIEDSISVHVSEERVHGCLVLLLMVLGDGGALLFPSALCLGGVVEHRGCLHAVISTALPAMWLAWRCGDGWGV